MTYTHTLCSNIVFPDREIQMYDFRFSHLLSWQRAPLYECVYIVCIPIRGQKHSIYIYVTFSRKYEEKSVCNENENKKKTFIFQRMRGALDGNVFLSVRMLYIVSSLKFALPLCTLCVYTVYYNKANIHMYIM